MQPSADAGQAGALPAAVRLAAGLFGKNRELLNWTPPVSVDEALRKTAKHFLEQQSK